MRFTDIIEKKRDGHALTREEIHYWIENYVNETIPDYQVSALCMAIYFNGMNDDEIAWLCDEMLHSGEVIDLTEIEGVKADKHSTGGVGDKTSLIVAPICASLGIKMAKMSGRGLGHTGGTIDKLESIEGFNVSLETEDFFKQVNEIGISIIGQTGNLAPADKKIYALRDVTATVDNIPLIASSIMSKKLAGGADCIVLDVKCGSGAFMKDEDSAKVLASEMVEIGRGAGKKIAALITDMDVPLGCYIGNSLEIIEAVETLKGNGPDDLTEICVLLAAKLLELAGQGDFEECKVLAKSKIDDGSALKKLAEMINLQGGNEDYIFNTDLFEKAEYAYDVSSCDSGYITHMNAEGIGSVCVALGAGRLRKEDDIDHSAGIILHKKTGDKVEKGDIIATLYCSDKSRFENAVSLFDSSITIGKDKPMTKPLLYGIVG